MPVVADIYYFFYEGGREGSRPPVVLIHGAGGTHLYWPAEVRRLTGYRVFAIDLPGHGKSAKRGQQAIPGYTHDILEWLDVVGLHRAVFVGHSMGSAIALNLALEHPEHALGIALLGAGAKLTVNPTLLEGAASPTTFPNTVERVVSWSFSKNAPKRLLVLAGKRMAQTRRSVLHGDFLACNEFDEMARIERIEKPTLVVCGAEDKMTPVRYAQYLADRIPNANLKVIPDAGHMVMLEQPRAVAQALLDFLAGIAY
jgi:pimeloyl-ACP methyl ester carboxylesterase